jgi:hypothetical protein
MFFLALICIAGVTRAYAQENVCSAKVAISPRGLPSVTMNKWAMMQQVGLYSMRLDATANQKSCVNVTFKLVATYLDRNHQPTVDVTEKLMRLRGGQGSEIVELPGHKQDSNMRINVTNIDCVPC